MSSNSQKDNKATEQPSLTKLVFMSHMLLATAILLVSAGLIAWMKYRATYDKVESELLGAAELLNEQLAAGQSPQSVNISQAIFHRFGKADRDHAYWILWDQKGNTIASHGLVPRSDAPAFDLPQRDSKHPYVLQAYGRHLDLLMRTETGNPMLVGRPLAKEYDDFGRLAVRVCVLLIAGLFVAAVASWRLVSAITTPITQLANTAAGIRHQELDRRLPVPQPSKEMTACATALNGMLSELESAFGRQRRFTADAAHELRTPIAIISGQCALSLSRPRERESYEAALATCQRSADHMRRLIDQLLLLSRLDAGVDNGAHRPILLDQVCQRAVDLMQILAAQRSVRLVTSLTAATVDGDETQWSQVVLNLLSNAIQFSAAGSEVIVSTQQTGANVLLQVIDQGIGISSEHLQKVCDRFYQVDQARTTDQSSGTGLGLSIVSEIVRAHGGQLRIDSEVGRGTTVTVKMVATSAEAIRESLNR